jgi:acyl carrier protein
MFPLILDHIWAFDHTGSTEEDRNRTRMYQESTVREQYREQSFSLKDFVQGLQLRVEIAEATAEQLGRVSQLTLRTNQFNFTTVRRSENEIEAFLKREDTNCLAVCVADRFGDYGLVGVLMYETQPDRYKVDTFLLSCRVLGRGVEHALVSRLGQMAVKEGRKFVEFTYLPTDKNLPALEFITRIGDEFRNAADTSWTFPSERLAGIEYDPDENAPVGLDVPAEADVEKAKPRPMSMFCGANWAERLQRIGEDLYDIDRLAKAIDAFRLGKQPVHGTAHVAPGSTMETSLVNIWRKVLGKPRIGIDDNFFDVGGTSLRAVQVVAMVKKELNQALSIVSLFECPTVKLLAAKLNAASGQTEGETTTAAAAQRGQQRRYNTRRKAS